MNKKEAHKLLAQYEHIVDKKRFKGKVIDGMAIGLPNKERIAEIAIRLVSGQPFDYILHSHTDFEVYVFLDLNQFQETGFVEAFSLAEYLNQK